MFTNPTDGYKGINYSRFPAILTKAMQEQQEIIEQQQTKLAELEDQVKELTAASPMPSVSANTNVSHQAVNLTDRYEEQPLLYQNVPNPFAHTTTIRYYIPDGTSEAQMVFTSTGNGKVLKTVALEDTGFGELETNISSLPAGNYSYTLVINGQQTLSRQMVMAK